MHRFFLSPFEIFSLAADFQSEGFGFGLKSMIHSVNYIIYITKSIFLVSIVFMDFLFSKVKQQKIQNQTKRGKEISKDV